MKALLVGADTLGKIPNTLKDFGIEDYIHWQGRKKGMRNLKMPEVDMVIVFTDFIEHGLTINVKDKAKKENIECIFCKRSCTDLTCKLKSCKLCCDNCSEFCENRPVKLVD